jgi:cytochrome P450
MRDLPAGITVLDDPALCAHALRDASLSSNPGDEQSPNLLFMDGADHTRLRGVVRAVISRLEPLPTALSDRIGAVAGGLGTEFDLVADFARPVAAAVAAEVLGASEPFDARFLADLEATAANLDVWFGGAGAGTAALRVAVFFARSGARPKRGMALLRAAHERGVLTEDELLVTPVMLAHAAYENSLNFLAMAGLALARGRALPGSVRQLADELAPARLVLRRATEAITRPGPPLTAGDRVAIRLGPSAGPAFGAGRHACPGTRVALAEAEVALRALAGVLSGGATVHEVEWKSHPAFHRLARARVVLG